MINLSMSHPVPTFGDSFTITCYVCGMPSSKEWAQKARSRPTTPHKPYFPFLLQITPIGGALLREDGSTYLCAFCHASLEAQWNIYESQQVIPPPNRKYNIQKFICAVCGVETYRKRIRALPFQEFPFLEKQRQSGSITLGNNPLAIVCLDCSETLWAQSAEYDRWGLPVHKRHFNWMARPPPPEDSVEATVARLPSGETQLPRCPPIEPSITPSKNVETSSSSTSGELKRLEGPSRGRGGKGKGDSPKLVENTHPNFSSPGPPQTSSRKSSLTSTTPPSLDLGGFHSQQPPVVTVAPMSSHTTVISLRKEALNLPSGLLAPHHPQGPQIFTGQTAVYPPAASYSPYVWGNPTRDPAGQRPQIEAYPAYGGPQSAEVMAAGPWPWIPHPSTDLLRYQSYVTSLQNRSRLVESSASTSPSHTSAARSSSSPSSGPYAGASSSTPQAPSTVVSGALREHDRIILEEQRQVAAINSERGLTTPGGDYLVAEVTYQRKRSPDRSAVASTSKSSGKKSPKILAPPSSSSSGTSGASSKLYPSHPKKLKESTSETVVSTENLSSGSRSGGESEVNVTVSSPITSGESAAGGDEDDRVFRREYHIPKKRNWHVFMKESQSTSSTVPSQGDEKCESPPPQILHHPKKKKSSLSDCSVDSNSSKHGAPQRSSSSKATGPLGDSAMDLTTEPKVSSKGGNKFRIEYLCQSTTKSVEESGGGGQPTSVIRCAPKVPPTVVSAEEEEEDGANDKLGSEEKTRDQVLTEGEAQKEKVNEEETMEVEMGEEEDRKKEGKSETQEVLQEGCTMNTDDDDDKHEDLPNIEQFIKETVLELVSREKAREKVAEEEETQQKQFLHELGLITPDKKIDLEIKSIVSRHERKTLPPLQLRADSKLGRKIDKQLKELLLQVSLQDPTLFEDTPEVEKCDFMKELGMKTAQKSEKTRREIKWRVILMERMRRELRNCAARGVKHEWEKSDILKKFASCDLDSFFNSLSYAALQASEEELEQSKPSTSGASSTNEGGVKEESTSDGGSGGAGVCINYPKYIPSYAVTGSSGGGGGDTSPKSEISCGSPPPSQSTNFSESILKIPVVSPSKVRRQSDSSQNPEEPEGPAGNEAKFSLGVLPSATPYPLRIDNLVQCSTSYWQQMKRNIDEILNELESSKEDVPVEDKTAHIDKLRKHLKSQLSDIKEIEKRFRQTGKAILSTSRANRNAAKSQQQKSKDN